MGRKYLINHFDLYSINTKEQSEFSIKIDSIPNTKLKEVIKNGVEIIFDNQAEIKLLANILNIDIPPANSNRDIVFSQDDEIYLVQFTGPKIQENVENMPVENDVFFLKMSLNYIK